MNGNDNTLASDSTIYNYKLVKRIHHSYLYVLFFVLLFMLALVINLLENRALFYMLCYPCILVLHFLITKLYLQTVRYGHRNQWKFHYHLLWIGLVPINHTSLQLVQKVQNHVFIGGILVIAVLYPWTSTENLFNLLFTHLLLMIPRLWVLYSLRKYQQNGLIKINNQDTSCYLP